MPFIYNDFRRETYRHARRRTRARYYLTLPLARLGASLGFQHIDFAYVHGDRHRLHLGQRCSVMNTFFNVVSGEIFVGDDTLFSHNCQVLTGQHRFYNGRRASASSDAPYPEVPVAGNDIVIGSGCFIGSSATILANVAIGDHCIIGAGAVVTEDIPPHTFAAGVPAQPIKTLVPSSEIPRGERPIVGSHPDASF